jgi:lysophospholipase L1-like esterase
MTVNMSILAGAGWQFLDNNANPLTGGLVYTYLAGTTTPAATYTSSSGGTANTNPIVLDSAGRPPAEVWLTAATQYKFVLKDSSGVLIGTYDNIRGINDINSSTIVVSATPYNSATTLQGQLDNLGSATGSSNVGFTPSLSGTSARSAQAKLRDVVSVTDYGAVGDNSTVNTSAFNAMEADTTVLNFYVPNGIFLSGKSVLSKNYYGDGAVLLTTGDGWGNPVHDVLKAKTSGLASPNSMAVIAGQRTDVFIGDSITYGVNSTAYGKSYVPLLQQMLNIQFVRGHGSAVSGANFDYFTKTGSYSTGTGGPLKQSLVLNAGATVTIPSDNVEYIGVYINRTPSSGNLTVTANNPAGGTVALNSYTCAGTAANDYLIGPGTNATAVSASGTGWTYTIACTSGTVELTGLFVNNYDTGIASDGPYIVRQAASGYNTRDFVRTGVIDSIKAQIPSTYAGPFPRFILALGTNNIYNPGQATTSAQYKADLDTMINGLTYPNAGCVLVVPLRASSGTYPPVLEPFDNYRKVVYELARYYNLDVIDLSELDLITTGAYSGDGLHPNDYGFAFMADYFYQRLYANLYTPPVVYDLTLASGVGYVVSDYPKPAVRVASNREVRVCGTLDITGISVGSTIADVGPYAAPIGRRVFLCPTNTGFGYAIVAIAPSGIVSLINTSTATPKYVSVDIAYCAYAG